MESIQPYIKELERSAELIETLCNDLSEQTIKFKPSPDKWSILEVMGHLHDEEQFDFRPRIRYILEEHGGDFPRFDPPAAVIENDYAGQDFEDQLQKFLDERDASIEWLLSCEKEDWSKYFEHPRFGELTARFFLVNWVAHDLLHIRQILRLKFQHLHESTGINLDYAGTW